MTVCLLQDLVSEAEEGKEEEALGDVVEEELAATSQAVEEAARRIQVSPSFLSFSIFHSLTRPSYTVKPLYNGHIGPCKTGPYNEVASLLR